MFLRLVHCGGPFLFRRIPTIEVKLFITFAVSIQNTIMTKATEIKREALGNLEAMIRREFDEAKTKEYARQVIEVANYSGCRLPFIQDMENDFEGEYKQVFVRRFIDAREFLTFNFHVTEEDGKIYCWPGNYGETLDDCIRSMGWAWIVPREAFIDYDSLDTAADDFCAAHIKHHDPRDMIGAADRVHANRGLLKIETF